MSRKRHKKRRNAFRAAPIAAAWNAAHPEFNRRESTPIYAQHVAKNLYARNEFYHGHATFEHVDGIWRCATAGPAISFLLKLDPISAKMELLKRGFSWQWETQPPGHGKNPEARTPTPPGNAPGGTPCNKLEDPNSLTGTTKPPSALSLAVRNTASDVAPSRRSVERAEAVIQPASKTTAPGAALFSPLSSRPLSSYRGANSQRQNSKDTHPPGHTIPDASQGVERCRPSEQSTPPSEPYRATV